VIAPRAWLSVLEGEMARLRERDDPETIHQVRVASRHLDAWLRLARLHVLRDDLRWLRRAAGAVRDVDVVMALELDLTGGWSRWLRQLRRTRLQELTLALGSERAAALALALGALPALPRATAEASLRRLAGRALAAGDVLERAPDDVEHFHALRRAVRILRYGLEWLDEKTGAFRRFQEVAGRASDRALALQTIDLFPEADALRAAQAAVDREYAEHRRAALATWRDLRGRIEELT
jgi:CHAD domain-containing protein